MVEPEWAAGLTQKQYEYLIKRMWYDCEIAEDGDAIKLRDMLRADVDSAIKHGVFSPADKKSKD